MAGTAPARDFVVRSFDGTPIAGHFFPAATLAKDGRAPTVLVGPGFGGGGDNNPESTSDLVARIGLQPLRHSGYNVLTWDPRGFGASGDEVRFDSPDYEARDVQALIDFVSRQPEAQLDAPGDPRVGMAGASYGGGIQIVAAAIDHRIDAITPTLAWNSFVRSIYPDDTVRAAWLALICVNGGVPGLLDGLVTSTGTHVGSLDPHIWEACGEGLTTGFFSKDVIDWFDARGPGYEYVSRIRAPTLLLQGTIDTLIPLDEAVANYKILHADGVPTKMMWFCGGHGLCLTSSGPKGYAERAILRWFARYLKKDSNVDTGAPFEWIDQAGAWHGASGYPLTQVGELSAADNGTLDFTPADSVLSGSPNAATPALNAATVELPVPTAGVDVVGDPRLDLTYSGVASLPNVTVFAQVADAVRGIIAGNQVTPIPLVLDGKQHTASYSLAAIAQRVTPGSRYELQITPGTLVFAPQKHVGSVRFQRIAISLPVVADPHVARVAKPRALVRRRLCVRRSQVSAGGRARAARATAHARRPGQAGCRRGRRASARRGSAGSGAAGGARRGARARR
jgi:ABC-2 type transport system ATP-binding protein